MTINTTAYNATVLLAKAVNHDISVLDAFSRDELAYLHRLVSEAEKHGKYRDIGFYTSDELIKD